MGKGRIGEKPEYRRNQEHTAQHKEGATRYENIIASVVGIRTVIDRVANTQQARHQQTDTHERARRKREFGTIAALIIAAGVAAWGIIQSHSDTKKALTDARITAAQQHTDTLTALAKTDDTITAMKTQANTMRDQFNAFIRTQRASMFITDFFVSPNLIVNGHASNYVVAPQWENSGNTQTKHLHIATLCIIPDMEIADPFPSIDFRTSQQSVIGPKIRKAGPFCIYP